MTRIYQGRVWLSSSWEIVLVMSVELWGLLKFLACDVSYKCHTSIYLENTLKNKKVTRL